MKNFFGVAREKVFVPIVNPTGEIFQFAQWLSGIDPTLFLAKLIGLLFLVFSLLMAMNKRAMLAAIDELLRSRLVQPCFWIGDCARP